MKKEEKVQFSEEAEIFNLLAGTMDFFINDLEAMQRNSGNENQFKEYLKNAQGMKNNLLSISEKLKKL
jgi:uncharacterized protein YkuJ